MLQTARRQRGAGRAAHIAAASDADLMAMWSLKRAGPPSSPCRGLAVLRCDGPEPHDPSPRAAHRVSPHVRRAAAAASTARRPTPDDGPSEHAAHPRHSLHRFLAIAVAALSNRFGLDLYWVLAGLSGLWAWRDSTAARPPALRAHLPARAARRRVLGGARVAGGVSLVPAAPASRAHRPARGTRRRDGSFRGPLIALGIIGVCVAGFLLWIPHFLGNISEVTARRGQDHERSRRDQHRERPRPDHRRGEQQHSGGRRGRAASCRRCAWRARRAPHTPSGGTCASCA